MASSLLIKLTLLAAIISIAYSVGIYEQCAGDGYGTFPCNAGLQCFRRNQFYSSCQYSCPRNVGWECEAYYPVGPVSPIAAGWDQCGGDGWVGSRVCEAGYTCYARTGFYSQCRPTYDCPAGWICTGVVASTAAPTGPIILAAYSQCNNVVNAVCIAGTACYRNNDAYAECRPSCPATWACATGIVASTAAPTGPVILAAYSQCNNVVNAVCIAGTACYRNNDAYAECRPSCPATWACATDIVVATTAAPVAPVVLPAYSRCDNVGYAVCIAGTACYQSTAAYSECRPSCPATWACATNIVATTAAPTGPVILPAYSQCNNVGYAVCIAGTACYQSTAAYFECRPSCPAGWGCEADIVVATTAAPTGPVILPAYSQCNNVGYAVCVAGTACYRNTDLYAECRPSCPAGWGCEADIVVATTAAPVVPVVLPAYSQCNNVGNAVCIAGTACFRSTATYAECRPNCPATWACETDVAGFEEQCGGEDYIGLTRCAAGYACYARSKWYSHCAPSCPGADWLCYAK